MTPVYEVKTKHTSEMLKNFITFTYEVKNPRMVFHLSVFAIGFLILSFGIREEKTASTICLVLGLVFLFFLLFRKYIALAKLKKQDASYQRQSNINMVFGHSRFEISDTATAAVDSYKYAEVTRLYDDKNYVYLSINNQEIQMVPFADIIMGDPEKFTAFLAEKTGKTFYNVKLPMVQKLKRGAKNMEENWEKNRQHVLQQEKEKKAKKKEKSGK